MPSCPLWDRATWRPESAPLAPPMCRAVTRLRPVILGRLLAHGQRRGRCGDAFQHDRR
jgi:hypothetical protein